MGVEKRIDITGAGSGIGEALALKVAGFGKLRLIGGRREAELGRVGKETNATVYSGDLFDLDEGVATLMINSNADIQALVAAINIDNFKAEEGESSESLAERQNASREAQNAFLQAKLDVLKNNNPQSPKLVFDVNSVTSIFAELIGGGVTKRSPYALMKMQQAKLLTESREALRAAGVELVIVKPGLVDTRMVEHLTKGSDDPLKLPNVFAGMAQKKNPSGRSLVQERLLSPNDVAGPMANLINFFLINGEVPSQFQEWIMLNDSDLVVPKVA